MRIRTALVAMAAASTLSGCAVGPGRIVASASDATPPVAPAAVVTGRSAVKVPWQLTPASTASIAQGETTIVVADAKYGQVKGTKVAVDNLREPVIAYTPPTPEKRACDRVIGKQARDLGAFSVQTATAGPVMRGPRGIGTQQVFFRIIYQRPNGIEVRQAALRCSVDRRDGLLAADPV